MKSKVKVVGIRVEASEIVEDLNKKPAAWRQVPLGTWYSYHQYDPLISPAPEIPEAYSYYEYLQYLYDYLPIILKE